MSYASSSLFNREPSSSISSVMPTLPSTNTSLTPALPTAPTPAVISKISAHSSGYYYGWYGGIGALFGLLIAIWIGVLIWMYVGKRGFFAPYTRPKPTGYTGEPINGEQVKLTDSQKTQMQANIQAALARLAAKPKGA